MKINSLAVILCISVALLAGLLVLQIQQKRRMLDAVNNTATELRRSLDYMSFTFNYSENDQEQNIADTLFSRLHGSHDTYVYLPTSCCRACFYALLLYLQEHEVDRDSVAFVSSNFDDDIGVKTKMHGYRYFQVHLPDDYLSDILVLRIASGYRPIMMRYSEGYDFALSQFMVVK